MISLDSLESILIALLGAGVLAFFGTLISIWSNRAKTAAEVKNLLANAEKIQIELQAETQKQLTQVYTELSDVRNEKEKLRKELDRVHKDIEALRDENIQIRRDLSYEREQKRKLIDELDLQKRTSSEKDARVESLEKIVNEQKEKLSAVSRDVSSVKKVTGSLHLPARDDKKEL